MNRHRAKKKRTWILRLLVLAFLISQTSCSYLTDFIVVNESKSAIVVRYVLTRPVTTDAPPRLPLIPGIKAASEIDQGIPWQELLPSQYQFDPTNRLVVVSLEPKQALRIAQHNLEDGKMNPQEFSIEGIEIKGNEGILDIKGEQVYKAFVAKSQRVYTLRYD